MSRAKHAPKTGHRSLVAKSCNRCLALKMAHEFCRRPEGYYYSECRTCFYKANDISRTRTNTSSLDNAHNHRTEWSPSELQQVERLTADGMAARDVALIMGRSVSAIYNQRQIHGMRVRREYPALLGQPINHDLLKELIEHEVAQDAVS